MKRVVDMSGQVFSHLTVLRFHGISKFRAALWVCRCDCGKEVVISRNALITGNTSSCGCHSKDHCRTHGMKGTALYACWQAMKQRCLNPKHEEYDNYGGRGIKVCERWMKFENFFADMGVPEKGLSLDRKDNNKDYEPGNCRWISMYEQQTNKRNNQFLTINGVTMNISRWAKLKGVNRATLGQRIRLGWSVERLFDPPKRPCFSIRFNPKIHHAEDRALQQESVA